MPSTADFERAVANARSDAGALGLNLRTDTMWLKLLQARAPMMASLSTGVCHIGYSAYHPRANFSWLFPALSPEDRDAWLGGFVRHELAHCADVQHQVHPAAASSSGNGADRSQEVLADLAFALHVDQHTPRGDALIARLAALRAARTTEDPGHDSSAELRCYLSLRHSWSPDGDTWLARLRAWRGRCLIADQVTHDLPLAEVQEKSPQPVGSRR